MKIVLVIFLYSLINIINTLTYNTDTHLLAELRRKNTSKLWYDHLERQVTLTFQKHRSRDLLLLYKLLSNKAYHLAVWCLTSYAHVFSDETNDIINAKPWTPCGYVQIVQGILPSRVYYEMRTFEPLLIQTSFLLFQLESAGTCTGSSYVQLCSFEEDLVCPIERQFCGYRKPWVEKAKHSRTVVALLQWNVRYHANLTFTYTSIETQIAKIYREHSYHSIITIYDDPITAFILVYNAKPTTSVSIWLLQQTPGSILHFTDLKLCCYGGYVELYDGFENYYLLFQKKFGNFSEQVLNISSVFYVATIVFYPSENMQEFNTEVIALNFSKQFSDVEFLAADQTNTVNNNRRLLHRTFGINISSGGYPNVSFRVRTFDGWNENNCRYGGFMLSHEITNDYLSIFYDQGPFCTRTVPSEPFLGTHVPPYIVLGSFQYYLVLYAFGPWFNIDIDVIMRASECEGLFEPMNMCTAELSTESISTRGKKKVVRIVIGQNFQIICSALLQRNDKISFSLKVIPMEICIMFQTNTPQIGVSAQYRFEATMSAQIMVSIAPTLLPLYEERSKLWNVTRIAITGRLQNASNIMHSYQESYSKIEVLTFTSHNFNQHSVLYVSFLIKKVKYVSNCSMDEGAFSRAHGKFKDIIVDISSSCGNLPIFKQNVYVIKFHTELYLLERQIPLIYTDFETKCLNSTTLNSITVFDGGLVEHRVTALYRRIEISHAYPISFMVENNAGCTSVMQYRIRQFTVYLNMSFRALSERTIVLVSQTCDA